MIFMPPRHGKSELVSIRYAGWRLWQDPKLRVIISSYNQKLAERFSRSIRKLLSEEEDRRMSNADLRTSIYRLQMLGPSAPPSGMRKGSAFPETSNIENGGSASPTPVFDNVPITLNAAAEQPRVLLLRAGKAELSAHRAAQRRRNQIQTQIKIKIDKHRVTPFETSQIEIRKSQPVSQNPHHQHRVNNGKTALGGGR